MSYLVMRARTRRPAGGREDRRKGGRALTFNITATYVYLNKLTFSSFGPKCRSSLKIGYIICSTLETCDVPSKDLCLCPVYQNKGSISPGHLFAQVNTSPKSKPNFSSTLDSCLF